VEWFQSLGELVGDVSPNLGEEKACGANSILLGLGHAEL
jgi:hypothetical protein